MKKFKLCNLKDEDVMGGALSEDNVYIRTYGSALPGQKSALDLAEGESTLYRFRLSGQTGTYKIVRLYDEEN